MNVCNAAILIEETNKNIDQDKHFNKFLESNEYTLTSNSDWNWKKWNNGLNKITEKFAKFQDKLIYTNFIKNLNYYKLKSKININMLHIMIGRLDPHYGGIISINYCHFERMLSCWNLEKILHSLSYLDY